MVSVVPKILPISHRFIRSATGFTGSEDMFSLFSLGLKTFSRF